MLKKLENHSIVLPKSMMQLKSIDTAYHRDKPTAYAYRPKSVFPTSKFLRMTFSAGILVFSITRVSVLHDINK